MSLSEKILNLRNQGKSYNQIMIELNCSKSTVAYHCNPNQKQLYRERTRKCRERKTLGIIIDKPLRTCKKCNSKLYKENQVSNRSTVCLDCNKNKVDWSKLTISELKTKINKNGNQLRFHARIRNHSRLVYKSYYKKECLICKYNKHTDVCHIKPVSEFPETTQISVVNDISNLTELCPNCHWELDHNLIDKNQCRVQESNTVFTTL